MRLIRGLLAAGLFVLACALAAPALATTPCSGALVVRDAGLTVQSLATTVFGSSEAYCEVVAGIGLDGAPHPLALDNAGNLYALPLPSGAATSALQTTGNGKLDTLHSDLAALLAYGVDARPASATISAPDVAGSSVAGQNGVNIFNGVTTANSSAIQPISGMSAATITTTGSFSGSMAIEASGDGGAHFVAVTGLLRGTSLTTAVITAPSVISLDVTGMTNLRVRATSMSGSAIVQMSFSAAAGMTKVLNPLTVADANNAAFSTETPMTVGTTYPAGRSVKINCSVSGNVSVTYAGGGTGVWSVQTGIQTLPLAVTSINSSGTTATAVYANLN